MGPNLKYQYLFDKHICFVLSDIQFSKSVLNVSQKKKKKKKKKKKITVPAFRLHRVFSNQSCFVGTISAPEIDPRSPPASLHLPLIDCYISTCDPH